MGDEKQQGDHKDDLAQVAQQVGVVDATTTVSEMLSNTPLFGNLRFFGKTDFEGHRLNDMVALVDQAKPEDLELAGKALWDARDAITEAADELSGHIGRVDWDGEAGDAFRKWGERLVTHTRKLADFAEVAGTQITAAGTGLASVRSAVTPLRDTRSDPKAVDDFPEAKRVEGNAEYTAALNAEKDRQEAINQMNRLSSFYAVSEEVLAAQEPPTFEPMPGVGVPKPDPDYGSRTPGQQRESGSLGDTGTSSPVSHQTTETGTSHPRDTTPPLKHADGSIIYPDRNVGTEIDSVDTLLPQTTTPAPAGPAPSSGQSNPTGNGGPFTSGGVPPLIGGATGRTSAYGGAKTGSPISAQGRAATPGTTAGGRAGRGPTGPMGPTAATGQPGARGTGTAAGRNPVMGRAFSGGTPRPVGGTTGGRSGNVGATGAGRGNGVVGGRPAQGPVPGATGSRVPRGTVVGNEAAATSRGTGGRVGQRGVIGASNVTPGTGAGQTARRPSSVPDGVVGTPNRPGSGTRSGAPTAGGTGLVRDSDGSRRTANRNEREATRRSESSAEEERESCSGGDRRKQPPATD